VNFFEALQAEGRAAYTPAVLVAGALAFGLAKVAALDKPRFKTVLFFLGTHLAGLLATAGFVSTGSPLADTLRTPTWIFGTVAVVGSTASFLFAVVLPRLRLSVPLIVQDVLVGVAMVAASLGVASNAGVNLSGLIATSAVFTAILGFSLQDVIGNIAGGLALQVDNSIEVGDWIKVGDVVGKVIEVRWRHTAVETRNWETVLIPNTVMTKSNVSILGKRRGQPKQWRRWVYFHVDWRHQPGDVIDVVQAAVRAAQLANVAKEPPPNVVLMDMAETYGRYAVRYWLTDLAPDDPTDSTVRSCVYFALKRAGMSLAMPAHAIFVTEETSDRKAHKTEQQVERCRHLLRTLDLFAMLADDEREELARQLKYAPFAPGEVMTRQGADAHWLYLLVAGEAEVFVEHVDDSTRTPIGVITPPAFFGEMSLLTGEPRTATVIARTDCECYRLDKATFGSILKGRPELAEQIAPVLEQRRRSREMALASRGVAAGAAGGEDLLSKVRRFFGL
jgi:small-conductance mechanosensitive channel/CRP-like cAMP-binding protein